MKTKTLSIIIIIISSYNLTYAQKQYKSCLDSSVIKWSFLDYHIVDAGAVSTELVASGDTLINGYIYKRMYIDSFDYFQAEETNINWQNYTPYLYDQWKDFFIRESEDASKLYIFDRNENKEYLISDLNLQKGDGFQVVTNGDGFIETTVDSIYYKEDLKHIMLKLDEDPYNYYGITFIEGVGPDIWYIYPYYDAGHLNCFKNKNIFYKEGIISYFGSSCPCGAWLSGTGVETTSEVKNYGITVTTDAIRIIPRNERSVQIFIYGIDGRLWYNEDFSPQQQIAISTAGFSRGLYLLKITDEESNKVNMYKVKL